MPAAITILPNLERAAARSTDTRLGLRRWLAALLGAVIALGLQSAGLKSLPYASCVLEYTAFANEPAPKGSIFRLGSVSWDMAAYSRDPKLEPFRSFYRANCGATTGIMAAICVSDVFAKRFPFGWDSDDFCDRAYDPVASLAVHLAGHAGHCVQRSALLASVLLASGISARVVQVLGYRQGHTIVEVWTAKGWLLFDPSTGSVTGSKSFPLSSLALLQSPGFIRTYPVGMAPFQPPSFSSFYASFGPAADAHFFYPEPWLYLRTGPRFSHWPFRGRYVTPEHLTWRYGLGQRCYLAGIAISFSAAFVYAAMSIRSLWLLNRWRISS
jgi:hypothetical protein